MFQMDLFRKRSLRGTTGILAIAVLGALAALHHGSSASAAAFYRAGQRALVRHDLGTAAIDFRQASQLTNDPDKRAWAQYQLAACYEAQPSKRSQAIATLHALIQPGQRPNGRH